MTSIVPALKRFGRRRPLAISLAGALIGAVLAGGVAFAAIPDSGTGVFHGCVSKFAGVLRVVDPALGQKCVTSGPFAETPITWNQVGPMGPKGDTGATGAAGPQGLKGDSGPAGVQGPQGNIGAPGAPGAQGPQGIPGLPGDPGAQGPAGPASLSALQGTACQAGGLHGAVNVTIDPSRGAVSIVCLLVEPVSVTVTGGTLQLISLVSTDLTKSFTRCLNASSCTATNFNPGDDLIVQVQNTAPFTFTCPGAAAVPAPLQPGGLYFGECIMPSLSGPYLVTAQIGP
jgi:hypothetical protein